MLALSFSSYSLLLSTFFLVVFNWIFFFKNNFFHIRNKNYSIDKLKKLNVFKKLDYRVMLNFFLVQFLFYFVSLFIFREVNRSFWWGHFYATNFDIYLYYYVLLFNIICFFLMYLISKTNVNVSVEYVFTLANIMSVYYLLFFANTFYTAFFALELISCLIFYKFSISKFWFKNDTKNLKKKQTEASVQLLPKTFVNTLFFQYWSTFFSSVILLFALVFFFSHLSSSEWRVLNELNSTIVENNYFNKNFLHVCVSLLIIGVILKLGITPLHLYKVEIYKGIPLVSLFFYTTFFFLIYFIFFAKLIIVGLHSFSHIYFLTFMIVMLLGFLFVISLLFNNFFLKTFFAYSSVINGLITLFVLINAI